LGKKFDFTNELITKLLYNFIIGGWHFVCCQQY